MRDGIRISDVRLTPASAAEVERGLLGWVSFLVDERLRVDSVALRRTRKGRLSLTFPAKLGLTGEKYYYLHPANAAAREEIESQVFRALGLEEEAPR